MFPLHHKAASPPELAVVCDRSPVGGIWRRIPYEKGKRCTSNTLGYIATEIADNNTKIVPQVYFKHTVNPECALQMISHAVLVRFCIGHSVKMNEGHWEMRVKTNRFCSTYPLPTMEVEPLSLLWWPVSYVLYIDHMASLLLKCFSLMQIKVLLSPPAY
jgi:hypothetical protein